MIFRRLVLTLVLILFASVTIGVIVGLDDAARSDLVSRLPGSVTAIPGTATTVSPTPPASPAPRVTAVAKPKPTPTARPTTPAPSSTQRPTTRPKQSAKPKPTKPASTPRASTKAAKPTSPRTTGSGQQGKKGSKKKPPKYLTGRLTKGSGGTVYLTFDDGPSPYTARILQVLTRTGSTATFFHLGVNEPGYPHADTAIRKQGSTVGNHSYDHPDLTTRKAAQLRWQIRNGPRAQCFRPPYGATDVTVRKAIAKAGLRQVLWDVDTLDWTKPGVSTLAKSGRLKAIRNGSVILMHDGGGDRSQTVAALPTIIGDLHSRGFKIRALPYC